MIRVGIFVAGMAALGSGLAGCATLNEAECQTVDWRDLGYMDGVRGRPETRFDAHREACAKYGITADLVPYRSGRIEGVRVYCQPERGFQEGLRGHTYYNVCPPDLAAEFVAAYDDGRLIYDLRATVNRIEYDLNDLRDRIFNVKERILDLEAQLLDKALTAREREELRAKIRRLRRRRRELADEVRYLEEERFQAELDLRAAESNILY